MQAPQYQQQHPEIKQESQPRIDYRQQQQQLQQQGQPQMNQQS